MKRIVRKLAFVIAATAAPLILHGAAAAQDYPARPITLLVPAAAGGPSDTVARLIAEVMSNDIGQRLIVENVGGAGGSVGAGRVAKSTPDGYTLMLYHIGVATFGALYPSLPYKPLEAFDSIGLVTEVPLVLVGRKALPPTDIAGLFGWLRQQGGKPTFATAGVGAVSDLCGRFLTEAAGIKVTTVAYRGTGPAMNDLVGGQIDLMCDQTTNTANQIEAGQIKPFAVTTRERIAILPNTPTLAESGVKDFDLSAWHAIWAPKGTPEPIRQKLAASLRKALADPRVIERFKALGTTPVSAQLASPAALDERMKSEVPRWAKLLADSAQK